MCVGHGWAPLIPPRFSDLSSPRQTPAHRLSLCLLHRTNSRVWRLVRVRIPGRFLAASWPDLGQSLAGSPCAARTNKTNFAHKQARASLDPRDNFWGNGTMSFFVDRRGLFRASIGLAAARLAAGALAAPALIGRAEAAVLKLKLSSSQANDPKFANGRVFYDNLA